MFVWHVGRMQKKYDAAPRFCFIANISMLKRVEISVCKKSMFLCPVIFKKRGNSLQKISIWKFQTHILEFYLSNRALQNKKVLYTPVY